MRTQRLGHCGVDRTVACGACGRGQALPCRGPGHARRQRQVTGFIDGGDDRRGGPPGDTGETYADHGPSLSRNDRRGSGPGTRVGVTTCVTRLRQSYIREPPLCADPGAGTSAVVAAHNAVICVRLTDAHDSA